MSDFSHNEPLRKTGLHPGSFAGDRRKDRPAGFGGAGILGGVRELVRYRELLYMIAWRDIRVKYKQSVMGVMWAVFMPMIIVSAGILVKYGVALLSGKPLVASDIVGVSAKSVFWAFFVASIRFSANSLVGNSNLVTKIYFPRAIFPLAAVGSQLFDFAIASTILTVVLFAAGMGLSPALLWVPFLVFLLVLLVVGMGLLLSAANLFYRDVKYIVEVILTFAIFVTPVFYDASMFGKWSGVLMLNPVAPILEGLARCLVSQCSPDPGWLSYSAVFSIFLAVLSFALFKRLEGLFAERI
jgi:ABC-type polysaccharide/polyol phosphate export permease